MIDTCRESSRDANYSPLNLPRIGSRNHRVLDSPATYYHMLGEVIHAVQYSIIINYHKLNLAQTCQAIDRSGKTRSEKKKQKKNFQTVTNIRRLAPSSLQVY